MNITNALFISDWLLESSNTSVSIALFIDQYPVDTINCKVSKKNIQYSCEALVLCAEPTLFNSCAFRKMSNIGEGIHRNSKNQPSDEQNKNDEVNMDEEHTITNK